MENRRAQGKTGTVNERERKFRSFLSDVKRKEKVIADKLETIKESRSEDGIRIGGAKDAVKSPLVSLPSH